MIHVAGGVYYERCLFPPWNHLYGSAGRAAAAIAQNGVRTILHTYLADKDRETLDTVAATYGFEPDVSQSPLSYSFDYAHPLAEPRLFPGMPRAPLPPLTVESDGVILRFGMIESDVVVRGSTVVYDPQSAFEPAPFDKNGSSAKRLAIVTNMFEAMLITGRSTKPEALAELLRSAEVAIIKDGDRGALVGIAGETEAVPAFQSHGAFTIGSGDVFSAAFAYFWGLLGKSPFDSAELSSRAVAAYVESQFLPRFDEASLRAQIRHPVASDAGAKIYLAGPFFNLPQRWLITEARGLLASQGLIVLSPLHDVGVGAALDVAPKDIAMLKDCDKIFAILDGSDEGTLFEVGYARALGKPVIAYAQTLTDEELKMIRGTGCIIVDDFATAIVLAAQK